MGRTRAILNLLGNPQAGARGALIAGTNGKGSTAAFLGSILASAGHSVGTMPSPHLSSYTERIQLNGQPLSEAEFAAAATDLKALLATQPAAIGQPTEFELLTAMALGYLARRADRLVIEVGMGGRLDTTNVLDLGVAVITNVDLDHRQYLGDTVEAIAAEKAGIVKPGNLVITGSTGSALAIVETVARENGAELWRLGREIEIEASGLGWSGSRLSVRGPGFEHLGLRVPLLGAHQAGNAALAVAAAQAIGDATPEAVRAGLAGTRWPGRLEVLPGFPRLLLDGAHNPAGMRALGSALATLIGRQPTLVTVFGAMADKDLAGMLAELARFRSTATIFTAAAGAGDRGAPPDQLAALYGPPSQSVPDAIAAVDTARALAGPAGVVLVCGSLYLVGEVRAVSARYP